jgi:hypothetical protein
MSRLVTSRLVPRGPLQSRNFRLLMTSNVVSLTGSAVSFVAIPFAVLKIGRDDQRGSDTCLASVVSRWLGRSVGLWDPA